MNQMLELDESGYVSNLHTYHCQQLLKVRNMNLFFSFVFEKKLELKVRKFVPKLRIVTMQIGKVA